MTLTPKSLARLREAARRAENEKITANAEQLQDDLEKAQQRAHEFDWGTRILDERAEQEADRLRAENEKLRAKCEERKAVLQHYQWCDAEGGVWDPGEFALCPACGNRVSRQHAPNCAWQRALEDV